MDAVNRLRRLLRLETAMVGVALAAAAGIAYFVVALEDARAEAVKLRGDVAKTQAAVQKSLDEKAKMAEELKQLRATPEPEGFLSRSEALDLGTSLAKYVAERQLRLSSFDSAQTSASLAGAEYPAITYNLAARGTADSLIGLLGLVNRARSGVVQSLEFTRGAEARDQWDMSLGIVVFYKEKG